MTKERDEIKTEYMRCVYKNCKIYLLQGKHINNLTPLTIYLELLKLLFLILSLRVQSNNKIKLKQIINFIIQKRLFLTQHSSENNLI